MPRMMTFYSRLDGVSNETFQRELMDVHVPLVSKLPDLQRYQQNLTTSSTLSDDTLRGDRLPFEGIAELWFEKPEQFPAALGTEQGQQALAHAPQFLDAAGMRSMVVEEHRIALKDEIDPTAPNQPLRFMFFITRRPDVTFEEFKRHILKMHVPIVTTYPGLRRYQLAFNMLPEGQRDAGNLPFDAIAEHYYDSTEAYEAAFASPEAQKGIEDAKHFMSFDTMRMMVVKEHPIALGTPAEE
ncbi:EthD family reductase [bacterium]|nr:EthD family reductase [bacterium]